MTVPYPPIEPPAAWARFPDPAELGEEWVLGVTKTLSPGLVLQAYREGIFPWPSGPELIPWASPEPRTIFPLERAGPWPRTVRRSLKAAQHLVVTVDQAFAEVMRACGERPEGTWITPPLFRTYVELHQLGWGHSVEVWRVTGGAPDTPRTTGAPEAAATHELVGGLYGLAVGSLFAGESMFHRETGASKVAFVYVVDRLRARGFQLFDVQAHSDHLSLLGCTEIPRTEYLERVRRAVIVPARFA